jgi:hypothetical protein
MSLFLSRLNRTITVTGLTQTSVDGGGQPIFTEATDDKLVDGSNTYDIVGVATLDGRSASHHMELDLRRIT